MRIHLHLIACFAAVSYTAVVIGQTPVNQEPVRLGDSKKAVSTSQMAALQALYQNQVDSKKWDGALKTIDQMVRCAACKSLWRLRVYAMSGDVANYSSTAQTILHGKFKDDPIVLNEIAWHIVNGERKLMPRDLDLAQQTAEKAVLLSKGKDAGNLDTLAWTYHWLRRDDTATKLEREALAHAVPAQKDVFRTTLHLNFN